MSDFEFNWTFGDTALQQGPEVSYVFEQSGTYQIILHITGPNNTEQDTLILEILPSLQLMNTYTIQVDEPSGLTFGLDDNTLWTVSDRTGEVFQLDFQGNLLRRLNYNGGDLEGISFDARDSTLWLIDEGEAELIHIDTNGVELSSHHIANVSDGSGLEGIAIDPSQSEFFLLKEKDYSALLVLNENLETQRFQRIGFAPDYSGLFLLVETQQLLMLSHEASSIYFTDTAGNLQSTYSFFLDQPEGIVYNERDSIFYIVDDTHEKLYHYKFWD